MDLALIGNGSSQALVDASGSITWLCWPRFDSAFVFAGLIDEKKGGLLSVRPELAGWTSTQRYLEDTNVLETRFESHEFAFTVTDCMPRHYQGDELRRPRRLLRRIRPERGTPALAIECAPYLGQQEDTLGEGSSWLLPHGRLHLSLVHPRATQAAPSKWNLEEEIFLVLDWEQAGEQSAAQCQREFEQSIAYWRAWSDKCRYQGPYRDAVIRSALTLKLHQFDDSGAFTAAATTSIPEYPGAGRNWDYRYCWIRDAYFSVDSLRRLGYQDEGKRFIRFLEGIEGEEWQPLYGVGGETELPESTLEDLEGYRGERPVRIGNAAFTQKQQDIYGEALAAIAPFAKDTDIHDALIARLLSAIDRNFEVPDCGLWEKRDQPRIHSFSILMHWAGAAAIVDAASTRAPELAQRALELRDRARRYLDQECYRPALEMFGETTCSDEADASLLQMVNLGFLANDPRAAAHVQALHERLAIGQHLLHRYIHDDGLGATHAAFTVCGFWFAEALAHLGENDRARDVFDALLKHRNHVGLLSEDIDPRSGELWGNFPQTYSHVGIINTALALSEDPGLG